MLISFLDSYNTISNARDQNNHTNRPDKFILVN